MSDSTYNFRDVYSYNCFTIGNGDTANVTTVHSGGSFNISSGGLANNTWVYSGGNLTVYSGGTADNTNVDSEGKLTVYSGGTANNTWVYSEEKFNVYSGGTANNTWVCSGGSFNVFNGGTANNTRVSSGGSFNVFNGGTATNVLWSPCEGALNIQNGAVVTFASKYVGVYYGTKNTLITHAEAVMDNRTIDETYEMYVMSGGTANSTTVRTGGTLHVFDGGRAAHTTISGGTIIVSNGGMASITTMNSGRLDILSGGTAARTTVNSGGNLTVYSGGTAMRTTVSGDGIYNAVTVRKGSMSVLNGGAATSVYVYGNNLTNYGSYTEYYNAAELRISNGAVVTSAIVNGGFVHLNGTANDVTLRGSTYMSGKLFVSSGGIANGVVISGGSLFVSSGGTANHVAVESGLVTIFNGGIVNDMSVSSGGSMAVSGGKLTGQMSFADGATVIVTKSWEATIDFDLTQTRPGDEVLLDNLSALQGDFLYTLTVKDTQRRGLYRLAANAGSFYSTISVANTDGTKLGSVGVGETIMVGEADYTLDLDDGILTLLVECEDSVPPTVSGVKADITAPTNHDVVVTAVFEDETELEQTLYRIGENGEWTAYGNGATVSENTTVYFMEVDTSGNESGIVSYEVRNIDKDKPVITLTGDTATPLRKAMLTATANDGSPVYYRIGENGEWTEYKGPIEVTTNAIYFFKATDAARNEGTNSIVFENIIQAPFSDVAPLTRTWETIEAEEQCIVECSTDDFEHVIRLVVDSNSLDSFRMPFGNYRMRVKPASGEWTVIEPVDAEETGDEPKLIRSNADGNADVFFVNPVGTWESGYVAQHVGSADDTWGGTNEYASVFDKNKLADIFEGSTDANVLLLTDDANGDAIFVDDIYSASPNELGLSQSRIAQINEIRAGAGSDIVDMTSQRFEYIGDGFTIRGGDGNDVIWANKGDNMLFGDAGNDRIVGASGNDVITGGIGNDRMHGGGGDDVFAFCDNWGVDEIEQLAGGSVTLWFASGDGSNWNSGTLTYSDGTNRVTVSGVSAEQVFLKFGDDGSERHAELASAGTFAQFTSQKIFEESKDLLA